MHFVVQFGVGSELQVFTIERFMFVFGFGSVGDRYFFLNEGKVGEGTWQDGAFLLQQNKLLVTPAVEYLVLAIVSEAVLTIQGYVLAVSLAFSVG